MKTRRAPAAVASTGPVSLAASPKVQKSNSLAATTYCARGYLRLLSNAIEDRTTRIKPGEEVAAGIVAIDTAGHTPGHISLVLTSGSDKLIITADALQNAHIAFAHPDWQSRVDMDGAKAAKNRRRVLDMAATDKLQMLCYHIPFPGLGRVERKGSAFRWVADV